MKCIGQPGELARLVLFLASEGVSYITGQLIPNGRPQGCWWMVGRVISLSVQFQD